MNYLLEINAFYEWLETHPLQRSAISLWYALMHINNKTHWRKSFIVPISTLQLKAGLQRADLFKARKRLVEVGLIEYMPGCSGLAQAASYSLNPFFNKKGELINHFFEEEVGTDLLDDEQEDSMEPDDSENQEVPWDPVLPVKPQSSAEPYETDANAETLKNTGNRTQIVAEPDPVYDQNKNENLPNIDPISKGNKTKRNIEQDKSCLSSGDDGEQIQINLLGEREAPPDMCGRGRKIKRKMNPGNVIQLYNRICVDLPRAEGLSKERKRHISARLADYGDVTVRRMLQQAAKSDFLSHGSEINWKANIDWLFDPRNFLKVLEGHYAFLRRAKDPLHDYIGKPSPFELLEDAYNGIMSHENV